MNLDIDSLELQSGMRTTVENNRPSGQAFLCDKLENGAGYCRFLGQIEPFLALLRNGDPAVSPEGLMAKWAHADHQGECDTSCNLCLRDYQNLPYHGILDWRLALDMVRLALSDEATLDLSSPVAPGYPNYWRQLLEGERAPVPASLARLGYKQVDGGVGGLQAFVHPHWKRVLLSCHPLWQIDHPQVVVAREEAMKRFHDVAEESVLMLSSCSELV